MAVIVYGEGPLYYLKEKKNLIEKAKKKKKKIQTKN